MTRPVDQILTGAREALARLGRVVDATEARAALEEAVEALVVTVEELEVTTQELQLQNEELAATQRELAAEERAYRELFDLAPDAYLVTDRDSRISEANQAAAALLGMSRHLLTDRLLAMFVQPERRQSFRHRLLELGRGTRARNWELAVRPHRGAAVIVAADVDPARTAAGTVVGLRWVLRDVTDARRAQQALQQAFTTTTERYEHLREIDQWKDAFLAAAAHDLQAPLAVIRAGAETLVLHPDAAEEDVSRTAGRVLTHADRLGRLLRDLLDLDRFTRGAIAAERSPTDALALIELVVDHTDLGDHPVEVTGEPVTVSIDAARVEQIVQNLLLNAATHTASGTPVYVRVDGDEEGVSITVEDDGPGVPDEVRDDLFLPFVSALSHEGDSWGAGIGLSLVNLFARLHGGEVRVEDRDGGGARFIVELPGRPTP